MDLETIYSSKHLLLLTNNASFANANALYSYLLTLHKKVSLLSSEPIEKRFGSLPWYESVIYTKSANAATVIEVSEDTLIYIRFFEANAIKINKKMATSLYVGLWLRYKNFQTSTVDGMVFAEASKLIALGAEHQTQQLRLSKRYSLAHLRLKARLYESFELGCEASEVRLFVSDADLLATGASLHEAMEIMEEFLDFIHAQRVILFKKDESMRVIKIIEESRV